MVFLVHEAPDVSYDVFVPKAELSAEFLPFFRVEREFREVDRVIDDGDFPEARDFFSVHPVRGQAAAGPVFGREKFCEWAERVFHDVPLGFSRGRGAVVVQDADGRSRELCREEGKGGQRVHVRVDDAVAAFADDFIDFIGEGQRIFIIGGDFVDFAPERGDFVREVDFAVFVDDEIELDFFAVDMAVVVQYDGLDPTSGRDADDLEDADRLFQFFLLCSGIRALPL